MKYEVAISIYRISQDEETKKLSFFVYESLLWEREESRILSHEELYLVLCKEIKYFQTEERGE